MNNLIKILDNKCTPVSFDDRGGVINFGRFQVKDLHVASMKPHTVRGNHVHDRDEIICIMGGGGICEIVVEDRKDGIKEKVMVEGGLEKYLIKAGVKHVVKNIGEKEFYLVAFF